MNALFSLIFIFSALYLLVFSPENFLPALLEGSSKAATLCISLIASYALWLGLMQLWQDSGLSKKFSRLLRPIARRIFHTDDEATLEAVCMNLSVNLLGISGAATPYAMKAVRLLHKQENADYASAMFFALNATSLQLIPTSVIGIRASLHSLSPADIFLPTLVTTCFSTLLAALLTRLLIPPKPHASAKQNACFFTKTRGAGI